jgi:hypothetical protein
LICTWTVPVLGAGVVGRGEEALDLAVAEVHAAAEQGEKDKSHQECDSGLTTAPLRAAPPAPMAGFAAFGTFVERQVQLVDHLVCLRCASSQLCRISTAAAWSTTAR